MITPTNTAKKTMFGRNNPFRLGVQPLYVSHPRRSRQPTKDDPMRWSGKICGADTTAPKHLRERRQNHRATSHSLALCEALSIQPPCHLPPQVPSLPVDASTTHHYHKSSFHGPLTSFTAAYYAHGVVVGIAQTPDRCGHAEHKETDVARGPE